jgi:hypothetical protein
MSVASTNNNENFLKLKKFLSHSQIQILSDLCLSSEEAEHFISIVNNQAKITDSMPVTYEQDGLGDDAIIHLHYFLNGCDWYITEKDMDGGVLQAYGFAILNGDLHNAEMGYISISELVKYRAEMDFYFDKKTIGELKKERGIKG